MKTTRRKAILGILAGCISIAGSCSKRPNPFKKPGEQKPEEFFSMPDGRYLKVNAPDVKTDVPNKEQISQEVYSKITKQLGTVYTPLHRENANGSFYLMFTDVNILGNDTGFTYRIVDETGEILSSNTFYDDSGLSNIIEDVEDAMQTKAENERKKSGHYFANIRK